jgi:sodium transport system ATP-binding protein
LIKVSNVHKRFDSTGWLSRRILRQRGARSAYAVRDASFTCRPGRVFCLLGVNGAGKTTTLRMISTALSMTEGSIEVAGFPVRSAAKEVRRQLGFLTASTKLYHRLTADETIRYFADLHGIDSTTSTRRREDLYDLLGIHGYENQRVGKLSTGMRQKVSIARTLIHDPAVIVLDEATAGLDVLASRAIVELITRARASGKTVLFSTHRLGEVVGLADDLAVIHEGRILYAGTPDDFLSSAGANTIEAAFIATIENRAQYEHC